jgi:hypothetical protein
VIDPVEAVIALALLDPGLAAEVGDRIALRWAKEWGVGSKGLTLRWDGGAPDLNCEVQNPRLEARCYGGSFYEAGQVYRALAAWSRSVERELVETSEGQALVYSVLMASEPSMFIDPNTAAETLLVFLEASVAEPATA